MTTQPADTSPQPSPAAAPGFLDRNLFDALNWNWEKTLYLALIVAAIVSRFYDLGARVMSHDESLHTEYSWYLFQGRGFQHSPMMHGPLKFEVTAFVYWLVGDSDFTSRVPSALMGVATVALMYFFRKWLGRTGALVAALLALISPYLLYYSRYIRDEPYVLVWGMLTALFVIHYMESRASKYLYALAAVTAFFYATMETSFIYIAITMLFLGLHLVRELFAARWPRPQYRRPFELAFALTLLATLLAAALMVLGLRGGALSGTETAVPVAPGQLAAGATGAMASPVTAAAFWVGLVAAAGLLTGAYLVLRSFGDGLRRFAALDLLMVFGVFVLPQLAAFPVRALGKNPIDYTLPSMQGLSGSDQVIAFLNSNMGVTTVVTLLLLAISFGLGIAWDKRRFFICAGIFYGIYLPTFTTFFTNGAGIATGMVGSLGYWLEQQGVRRGGQHAYYFPLIQLPVYEFLPTMGALFAAALGFSRWLKGQAQDRDTKTPVSASDTLDFPVLAYLGFWAVMALIAFSIAGEKMPWLTTHITLPFILVSGWAIGWVIDGVNWKAFPEPRAWLTAAAVLVFIIALGGVFGSLLGANPPFQGQSLGQSQATLTFLAVLLVAIASGAGIVWLVDRGMGWGNLGRLAGVGVFGVMGLFTARAAFTAAYINYDFANEYLVYAHGAQGVKTVMQQVQDISVRMNDGLGLKVAYDSAVAWPLTWYLRDYTNQAFYGDKATREGIGDAPVVIAGSQDWTDVEKILGNRYNKYEYIRMVWPMQDYFGIETWQNVLEGLPLAPSQCRTRATYASAADKLADQQRIQVDCKAIYGGIWSNKDYRQALWNIWLNRDYTLYGQLTKQNFDLAQWPVVDRMRLYVRKDIAAQIWDFGVNAAAAPAAAPTTVAYDQHKQVIEANAVWGTAGSETGQFNAPRSVAVAPDGSIYVADSRNHRIEKFDANGQLMLAWGSYGASANGQIAAPGTFNEPWGIAVGPDGSVYVADTWNHRIQKFDANGKFLLTWGHEGQGDQFDALWGPRAVAVDGAGRVFVADTGNKRIAVFDANGVGLTSIGVVGKGGVDAGYLDEPVGVAVAPDGSVYVADTWNMRIQVFKPGTNGDYAYVSEWPIDGWYGQSLENKPYLALDKQGRVYATDPESFRVLVFDKGGQFLTTWGEGGTSNAQFGIVSGVALGADGQVFVADSGNNRVMRFPALP
jgi:predicted membrane-bound mannosyltransferase/sugar lactone lactonase YvrE